VLATAATGTGRRRRAAAKPTAAPMGGPSATFCGRRPSAPGDRAGGGSDHGRPGAQEASGSPPERCHQGRGHRDALPQRRDLARALPSPGQCLRGAQPDGAHEHTNGAGPSAAVAAERPAGQCAGDGRECDGAAAAARGFRLLHCHDRNLTTRRHRWKGSRDGGPPPNTREVMGSVAVGSRSWVPVRNQWPRAQERGTHRLAMVGHAPQERGSQPRPPSSGWSTSSLQRSCPVVTVAFASATSRVASANRSGLA
jgi:hypothetical protein